MYYKASKDMLSSQSLNDSEKLLMIVIEGLSQKEGYCFATNQVLANMLGWDVRKINRVLASVLKKDVITKEFVNNNGRSLRKLLPHVKNSTPYTNCHGGGDINNTGGGVKSVMGGVSNVSPILEEDNRLENNRLIDNAQKERMRDNFETFWDLYQKKIDRAKCFKKFSKLKEKEQDAILLNVRPYVLANPETQYRKNPLTYLNGRCWEDEIIENQKTKQNGFHIEISEEGLENFLNG
jgi:hypothetical protein